MNLENPPEKSFDVRLENLAIYFAAVEQEIKRLYQMIEAIGREITQLLNQKKE